jgi:hypothetical protein
MREIEDSIASRQVRSSAVSVLANLRFLRKRWIAFSVTGHSQKWIILEAMAGETGEPWMTAKERGSQQVPRYSNHSTKDF